MKNFFPEIYNDYIREILSHKKEGEVKKSAVIKLNKEKNPEKDEVKNFIPILKGKGELFDLSIKTCKDRLIPEEIYSKWYVALNGKYKKRLIIPFYDDKNKIYYWQGRALFDWMIPKYMSRLGYEYNNIYNYYTVDKNKEVMIVEGMIDSLFLENSVAMTGLKLYDDKLNNFKQKYFLLDNDKSGKIKALKALKKEQYVFNWTNYIRDLELPKKEKWDINDVAIHLNHPNKFTFEELKKYFTNSVYDEIYFVT
jgi:hypothetical protein